MKCSLIYICRNIYLVDLKYIFVEIVILIVLSFRWTMSVIEGVDEFEQTVSSGRKEVGVGLLKCGMILKYYLYMKMTIEKWSAENVLIF